MTAAGTASLEDRIALLEAKRDIEELVYLYAELCDRRYDPDRLAELFTEDATWSSSTPDGAIDFGTQHGREAIRANFAQIPQDVGEPTLHTVIAPQITVAEDGQTATGRWRTIVLLPDAEPKLGVPPITFLGANYEHEYRKVDDRWLFTRIAASLDLDIPLTPRGALAGEA